jgi:hypothetical protein
MSLIGEASPPLADMPGDVEDVISGQELGGGAVSSVGRIVKAAVVNGRTTSSTAAKM